MTAIHSVAGTLPTGAPLVTRPTFEAPHHSATMAALIGGGSGQIRPGAVCRAHRGVLFLDEAPEFPRAVLDTLRQPLERGQVTIHAGRRVGDLPVPRAAGAGGQPVPVRERRRRHRLHLQPAGATAIPVTPVRAAAGPHRPPGRPATGHPGGLAGRLDAAGDDGGGRPAGRGRAGHGGGAAGRDRARGEQPDARAAAARALDRAARVAAAGRAGAGAGRAVGARASTACCASRGRSRTSPVGRCRAPTRWPRPSACACSGRRRDAWTRTWRRRSAGARDGDPGLRRARAWLSRAVEPGTIDLWRCVEDVGPVEAVRRLRSGRRRSGSGPWSGPGPMQDATLADLARAERCGARLVVPEDDEWPALPLHALTLAVAEEPVEPQDQSDRTKAPVPPVALWVRGTARLDELVDRSVAIVGSRASTAYGEHVAAELGHQLGERGLDRRLRRGVRHRRGRAPRRAGRRRRRRWRCWPAGSTGPTRRRTARCSTGSPRRAAGQRVAAGLRAAAAPVPGPQPADRRADPGHRRGRGGGAVRRAGDRAAARRSWAVRCWSCPVP